jgi:macrolide-specific efflux system membrane fusion protein
MRKSVKFAAALAAAVVGSAVYGLRARFATPPPPPAGAGADAATVERGSLSLDVKATGTVAPQNRLVVHLPVAGRVESLLVVEGQRVRKGQLLAWISSDERAALLDAAAAKGAAEEARWKEFFKATPLYSPIDGMVIARDVEPGQSLATTDTVLVLSNRLVVTTDVDETDLAQIRLGQKCAVTLDAYPDRPLPAKVSHIAYEAKTVNNVTIYEVQVAVDQVPAEMRSGMTAEVVFSTGTRQNVLLLPVEAVRGLDATPTVRVLADGAAGDRAGAPQERTVTVGSDDGKRVEILGGVAEGERVAVDRVDLTAVSATAAASNPFFNPPKRSSKKSSGAGGPPPPPGM